MGFDEDYVTEHPDSGRMILNWRKVPQISCTAEEFNRILKLLSDKERDKNRDSLWGGSRRLSLFIGKYYIKATKERSIIFDCTLSIQDHPVKYCFSVNKSTKDQEEEEECKGGYECYCALVHLFKEKRGTKSVSIRSAFSDSHHKQEYKDIKHCVPKQIQHASQAAIDRTLNHVYKADISSAFPSSIVKAKLPTLNGCKRVEGFVAPTDEYPFAFYIKSHHLSIKDEFSTWEDADMMGIFYHEDTYASFDAPNQDEITILCKEAKMKDERALWDSYYTLYMGRKDDPDFKSIMCASIGYFHMNVDPFCSILAAVTIARTNHRIFRMCRELIEQNNLVLLVATDSIAWKGKEYSRATHDKRLGSFTYECFDSSILIRGCKNYQYINMDGKCVSKASGYIRSASALWKFGEIPPKRKERKRLINQNTGEIELL